MKTSLCFISLLFYFSALKASEDPLFPSAWHLENTGQTNYAENGGTPGFDIKSEPVHASGTKGEGIKVAISDTGIDVDHEDLNLNFDLPGSRDFMISETEDNPPLFKGTTSIDAHGTSVTGIIAAVENNNLGSKGIAPLVSFGGFNYLAPGVNPGVWIYQMEGPFDIFNYSYGMAGCFFVQASASVIEAYKSGVSNLRDGKGALYIKASGNDFSGNSSNCNAPTRWAPTYYGNSNYDEGQNYPYTLLVSAINADGFKSSYSTPGSNIWVTAPGGEYGINKPALMTTDISGCYEGSSWLGADSGDFDRGTLPENWDCNYTNTFNGTSAGTPNVVGVVALILAANPNLTWRDVKHILATWSTVIDLDSGPYNHPGGRDLEGHTYRDGWVVNRAGYLFHTYYGFGLVNAQAAVEAAKNFNTDLGRVKESLTTSGSLNNEVPNNLGEGLRVSLSVKKDLQIEAVQVIISMEHEYIDNIGLELTSPSGTKSIILNINSNNIDSDLRDDVFLTNAFYGESSKGNWTLKIIDGSDENPDGSNGSSGTLTKWKINIIGHEKKETLTSHQTYPQNTYISKIRKIKKYPKVERNVTKDRGDRHKHPADPYLIEKTKEFLWSHNIFAIFEKDYRGPSYNILGTLFKLNVILSDTKPLKGYYVIKSRRTGKLGIFTGYLTAFGESEKIEKFLEENTINWDKVAGIYVFKVESVIKAYELRNHLRIEAPNSTVDMGLEYSLNDIL